MSDHKNSRSPGYHKSTPPPSNRKVRNPFDKVLIDRLHKPLCSPGMCKIYKKKQTGTFRWDIDQACTLVPADIVACSSQFEPSPDPALERIAEEATEKFFSQELVIPSPMEASKKVKPLNSSCDASIQINSFIKEETIITRDISAQTVLTLPPELPPDLEKLLQPFCTFTQDQDISGEYEITVNGSLRRKLFFEEHSDMEHYDSEHTDEEIHVDNRPPSSFEAHTPIIFSPDLSQDLVAKGMKRTFGTPLKKGPSTNTKSGYRNKILDVVDFGETCFSPIEYKTPKRNGQESTISSSITSGSISPVNKATPSDEEKNNFISPDMETIATCLVCVASEPNHEKKNECLCKITPNKIMLKRSASLKDSPPRSRKGSISGKRSLSMSSLHRSRSVQKLDFSMDMSIDGSFHDNSQAELEYTTAPDKDTSWCLLEDSNIHHLVKIKPAYTETQSHITENLPPDIILDETPIKGRCKNPRSHEISKIRNTLPSNALEMSLDSSSDNPLSLEDKKIDFNTVDLKFLTDNVSQFNYTANDVTKVGETSTSFKRVDSGFTENTFYGNASSYYESAIKPSELTITNVSKTNNPNALKEISNVHWMRVDSGFNDESSADCTQFYTNMDKEKMATFNFSEAKVNKENMEDFDRILVQSSNKNDPLSMSEIFTEDMTFTCNFSSTPSKNKSRKVNL